MESVFSFHFYKASFPVLYPCDRSTYPFWFSFHNIIDRLQVDEPVKTVPTIGFNVETLQYKNIKFQVRRIKASTEQFFLSRERGFFCLYPRSS